MYAGRHLACFSLALILLMAGCSSEDGRRKAIQQASLDPTQSIDEIYAKRFALEEFEKRLDNAQTFHATGSEFLFRSVRDSLVTDINRFVRANPHMETDEEFVDFLTRLSVLDTLEVDPTVPTEGYAGVEDSLALSFADWPELDIKLDPGLFSMSSAVFPVIENKRIDFWVRYFTGPGRERFGRAMYRMQLHRPTVERILDELDLPVELAVVGLIESGYSMRAVSSAKAVGPWQFIYGTGKNYGLRINWWYDERRDIVASTYAAGNYLTDLHGIWGDWMLAMAAYNCGEYRVARQVGRQKTENFWLLQLPRQTQRYVPKFLAALYILRDPGKYGFTVPDAEPHKFDLVTIKSATDLKVIARCAGTSVEVIKELNPQCLRSSTPPHMEVILKVPSGSGEMCVMNLDAIPESERITWTRHQIKKGETLSLIASKYGTSVSAIKQLNNIRNSHRIREGHHVLVPMKGATAVASSISLPQYKNPNRSINKQALERYAQKAAPPKGYKRLTYTVKDNDTLGEIAEVYRTSARKIRSWNNLSYRKYIHPGQKLAIYVRDTSDTPSRGVSEVTLPDESCCVKSVHVVRKGDTFYSIGKTYNVSISELLAWNNKTRRTVIRPGDRLAVWSPKK